MQNQLNDPLFGTTHKTMPPFIGAALSYPSQTTLDWHSHKTGQVIHTVSGTLQLWAADHYVLLPPTMALWVPPDMRHRIFCKTKAEMRTLYVRPGAVTLDIEHANVFAVSELLRALILAVMPTALSKRADKPRSALYDLLIDELSESPIAPLHLPLPTDSRLRSMIEQALVDVGEIDSVHEWSTLASASRKTIERVFVVETGLTPSQWLKRARVIEAVTRLSDGEAIGTIALDLGYSTASAFTYMFRQSLGVSPSTFAKNKSREMR